MAEMTVQYIEVDSQTTAAILTCEICGKKSKPIYGRGEIEVAMHQHICKGDKKGGETCKQQN
jgi:hypothetical protein